MRKSVEFVLKVDVLHVADGVTVYFLTVQALLNGSTLPVSKSLGSDLDGSSEHEMLSDCEAIKQDVVLGTDAETGAYTTHVS